MIRSPGGRIAKRGETILVIDTEESVRTQVCRILDAAGYQTIPVSRALEAHWCVDQHGLRFDLLVTDLVGPEDDHYGIGIPVGRCWPSVPVVFMSRTPRETSIRDGRLHPHAPFLQHPFPPHALTTTVRRVLDRWVTPPPA